ncbi:MAG: heat-inducible transcriptional repressor HrcA [Bacilli bacterium]
MLSIRQKNILKFITEFYIKTVEPISSSDVCEVFDVSSATVRNEMAVLEKHGLIAKTHFASGRKPTELGYKYYVNNLMEDADNDRGKVRNLFASNSLVLKDAVYESIKLISDLTDYSVVMLGSLSEFEKLKEVKIVGVDNHSVVSIIVTNTGRVFNRLVSIDEEIDLEELRETVVTISDLLTDTPMNEVVNKLELEVKPVIKTFIDQHNTLYEMFIESIVAISKNNNEDIKFKDYEKLINQPEFDDIGMIRKFIKEISDETILSLLNYSDDIDVRIGEDNVISNDLSVITTKYRTGKEEASVAVIGPTRMDYNKVVNLLQEIKDNLDRINKENDDE